MEAIMNPPKPKPRHLAQVLLTVKFLKDYKEVLKSYSFEQQIEITEHLIGMVELMEKNLRCEDEAFYYEYMKRESALLKKYGKTLKPFMDKSFYQYFYFEFALTERGVYTKEELDNFFPEQKLVSVDEVYDYHQLCLAGLNNNRNLLYLQREPEFESHQKPSVNYAINWTGKRDNKNEFVQLIYALHEAGLINNGTGEITKIVDALAEAFNIKLSKNWQSNHSNSIHRQNRDYEPTIFKTVQEAYQKYCVNLRKEKLEQT